MTGHPSPDGDRCLHRVHVGGIKLELVEWSAGEGKPFWSVFANYQIGGYLFRSRSLGIFHVHSFARHAFIAQARLFRDLEIRGRA